MCHILRRFGDNRNNRKCDAGVKSIGRITRTHPVYVRWVIRHLIQRKLVVRLIRPGRTSVLEPALKYQWLAKNGPDADQPSEAYEETADEASEHVLWARLWVCIPQAPRAPFAKQMKEDRWLFERVLAETEDRIKRGRSKGSDSLGPLVNPRGYWNYTWEQFKKANTKK